MVDVFQAAADFNQNIIGIDPPASPVLLSKDRRRAIADHLREEAQELEDAETIADQCDALTDVIFIAAGRFYETGTDGHEHYAETSYANMGRVRGDNPTKRPGSVGFDAIKPDGWIEPDHEAILAGIPASRRLPKVLPKVLVLGHARHGKDTVAELLRDRYGLKFQSSSMFLAEQVIFGYFNSHPNLPSYDTLEECYADRVNHRALWFDLISGYNAEEPARLATELLKANDLYVGMRSAREYAEAQNLFDHIVWVDRPGFPLEDRSSFDIDFKPGRKGLIIRNDGTLEDLSKTVDRLAQNHLGLEPIA